MILTRHATKRWAERFPGLDAQRAFDQSRRAGRKIKARIRDRCPKHAHMVTRQFRGAYYRVAGRIVFVCVAPERIITVFALA
jgi:hypothetical protein